jgi:hypothetical protein
MARAMLVRHWHGGFANGGRVPASQIRINGLSFASIAAGFALLAADLSAAAGLTHSRCSFHGRSNSVEPRTVASGEDSVQLAKHDGRRCER